MLAEANKRAWICRRCAKPTIVPAVANKIKSDKLGTVAPKIGKLNAPVISAAIIEKNKIDAELSPPFILLVTRSLNVASKAVTIGTA